MIYLHLSHHSLSFLVYGFLMAIFLLWICRSCMYPLTGVSMLASPSVQNYLCKTYIHCRIVIGHPLQFYLCVLPSILVTPGNYRG